MQFKSNETMILLSGRRLGYRGRLSNSDDCFPTDRA